MALFYCLPVTAQSDIFHRGVNISGLELGHHKDHYIVPQKEHYDYWLAEKNNGINSIRLPFLWERLQPTLQSALNVKYLNHLKQQAAWAKDHNITLILDMHNMARYRLDGTYYPIGTEKVSKQAYYDVWIRLASHFKNQDHVIFGLMNEPMHYHTAQNWFDITQELILALRERDIKNTLLVSGVSFSGAHSWVSSGNAEAFKNITDPENNLLIEIHQYFDYLYDGQRNGAKDPDLKMIKGAVETLYEVTCWARKNNHRLLLGETGVTFGGGLMKHNMYEIENILRFLEYHNAVWRGYFFWGAGAGWPEDYALKLSPSFDEKNEVTGEQIEALWYKDFVAEIKNKEKD